MKKLLFILTIVFAVVVSQSVYAQDKPAEKKEDNSAKKELKFEKKIKHGKKDYKKMMECCKDKKCRDKCTGEKCDSSSREKCTKGKKECQKKCDMKEMKCEKSDSTKKVEKES